MARFNTRRGDCAIEAKRTRPREKDRRQGGQGRRRKEDSGERRREESTGSKRLNESCLLLVQIVVSTEKISIPLSLP